CVCVSYDPSCNCLWEGGAKTSEHASIHFVGRLCQPRRRSGFTQTPYNFRQQIANGCFQPAEAEVLRVEHAAWQIKTIWIAVPRGFFNFGPAWITESEHLGHLIECFASGIIDSSTD